MYIYIYTYIHVHVRTCGNQFSMGGICEQE